MRDLVTRVPDEVAALSAAGYPVENDEQLVAAWASHYHVSEHLARRALNGNLDDVLEVPGDEPPPP